MDRKGPCMGRLFILPAGLSMRPLSAPSKLPTQSHTRQEYHPPHRSLHPSFLTDSTSTSLGSPVAAVNRQGGFLHRVRRCYIGLCVTWLLPWTAPGGNWKSLPKPLDWVILLLEVSPCLRQMAKPVSSLQVQKNQARTLQTLSRHLTSLSGRCPDWLCVPTTLCMTPPGLTLPSSATWTCCCPS